MDDFGSSSIEKIFNFELKLIKLAGGFLINTQGSTCIIYRAVVIFLTKTVFSYFDRMDSKLNSPPNYIELVNTVNLWISCLTIAVTVFSSIRYHNALVIILKKRLDRKYIHNNCTLSIKSAFSAPLHWIQSKIFRLERDEEPQKLARISRINLARLFLATNLIIIFARICIELRTLNYAPVFVRYSPPANVSTELETNPTTDAQLVDNATKVPSNGFDDISNSNVLKNNTNIGHNENYDIVWNSVNLSLKLIGYIIVEVIFHLLQLIQSYGHIYVVLFITATICDMLYYTCFHDGITIGKSHKNKSFNSHNSSGFTIDSTVERFNNSSCIYRSRPLVTTELLIQIRDVLIMLRCCLNLDYFMILISDLSKLMNIFCMLNIALIENEIDLCIVFVIDYITILWNMTLARIGYHWVHSEAMHVKRIINEMFLLADKHRSSKSETNILSQAEKMTTDRLADDIVTIWPTDWFKPDLIDTMKNNVFVMTFVATLQQLVEAGSKV